MEQMPLEAMAERDLWDALPETSGMEKADIFMELHRRSGNRGDHLQAASFAEEAATECMAVDNFARAALCKFAQGRSFGAAEMFEQALDCFLAAADLDGKTGNQGEIAADLRAAADVCARLERVEDALRHFRTAESLYTAVGQLDEAGRIAYQIGQLLLVEEQTEAALTELERARDYLRQAHDIEAVAAVDDLRAGALLDLDRVDEAVEVFRDCLRIAESSKGERDDAYARHRLAKALWDKGEAAEALHHLERAREQYLETEQPVSVAACDLLAANCLRALGETDRAEELLRSARAVYDAAGFVADAVRCDVDLSILAHMEGRYSEAAAMNRRLAEMAKDGFPDTVAYNAVSRWADNLLAAGDAQGSVELLRAHKDDPVEGVLEASRLWRLSIEAQALQDLGDHAAAVATAEQGIAMLPDEVSAYGKAACYEIRGLNALESDRRQAERDLGHAIALYLGVGQDDRARRLSRHFMPESPNLAPGQPGDDNGGPLPTKPPADTGTGMYL